MQRGVQHTVVAFSGQVTEADIHVAVRFLARLAQAPFRPGYSLVDVRKMAGVSPSAFAALLDFLQETRARWGDQVLRQALLCDQGPVTATAIGLLHHVQPLYSVEVFTDQAAALEWLGAPAIFARALEIMEAARSGASPLVQRVLAAFETLGVAATPEQVAAHLGTSARSLQRHLQRANTTLRDVRERARLELARRALQDSSLAITQIAPQIGFASASSFVAWFRVQAGETPQRWRLRVRSA